MPMPRLPETHHKNIATKNAFQVKKKSAAIAPTWNRAMKVAVIQLISPFAACGFSRSCSSISKRGPQSLGLQLR